MVGTRLRGAMADLAETIRRVFQSPISHGVSMELALRPQGRVPPLEARVGLAFSPCAAVVVEEPLFGAGIPVAVPLGWAATVGGEPGWKTWEAGAKVSLVPTFRAEKCARLEVPALPRRAVARRERLEAMTTRSRSGWEAFPPPGTRCASLGLGSLRAYPGLDRVIGLPVAVVGEDLAKLSKTLQMRYTLQLVRSTGQNIRNLDVLGLYRIPAKGTRQLHHDPASNRLLVVLGPEAAGARRALFMLARCKNDASIVYCFVEEA